MYMVAYSDLFQLGILIVSIISLVIQVNNKKKYPLTLPSHGYFL